MKKIKPSYNPNALSADKKALFKTLLRISTIIAAAVGTLLFLVLQLLLANGAHTILKNIVTYLSEIISTVALFTVFSLVIVAVMRNETELYSKTLKLETIALATIAVAARFILYFLSALIDTKLGGSFYFCDVTFYYLTESNGYRLWMWLLSALVNSIALPLAMIVVTKQIVSRQMASSREKLEQRKTVIPVLVYLAVSLLFAIIDTVLTIISYGISASLIVIVTLVTPYIEIVLYSLLGYFTVKYVTPLFEE